MKENKAFSLRKRLNSFRHAFNGIKLLFQYEHNARIHLAIAMVVVLMGLFVHLNAYEWIVMAFCIGLVFSLELINSAIEYLSDIVSPEIDERIKRVKDLSAAAVLVAAIVSTIIGAIVLLPKIWDLINNGN